ncbi:hypothetical protein [Cupriavidus taiwanensis]|uniref:hypothetical protein n=1 Tax=Cupriavidus taiwanensis TaxID=164546 RepID=UPI000E2FA3EB|nr:hypothetical protein [Cupriavidus taiwanensis]
MQTFDLRQFPAPQTVAAQVFQQHMRHMQAVSAEQLADILETSVIESTMDAGFAVVHRIRLHGGQGQQAVAISTCYGDGDSYILTGL